MIPGVIVTKLERFSDDRGHFSEIARSDQVPVSMKQASHSHSKAGVLRGLHFHRRQTDLWYLAHGQAQIALADLRSPETVNVMSWVADATEPCTILIPPGIAHGYLALTDIDVLYWTSHTYDPSDEYGIAWDDPTLAIGWERPSPVLSERDRINPKLSWQDIPGF